MHIRSKLILKKETTIWTILIIFCCFIYSLGQTNSVESQKIFGEALLLFTKNDYANSIKKFKFLLETHPEFNRTDIVYYWLGTCYSKLQDYVEAIKYFYAITVKYPNSDKLKLSQKEIKELSDLLGADVEIYSKPEYNDLLLPIKTAEEKKKTDIKLQESGFKISSEETDSPNAIENQPRVSNVFYETDLRQALQDLSSQAGVSIYADNTVQGFVTMEINDLPLETALHRILMIGGYTFKKFDNYYVVGSVDPNSPTFNLLSETKNIKVNYIPASEAVKQLSDFYTSYIKANDLNNTITVSASPDIVEKLKEDLSNIDIPPKQVEIEAIIMDVTKGALKSFGIDWQIFGSEDNRSFGANFILSPGAVDTLGPMTSIYRSEKGHLYKNKIPLDIVTILRMLVTEGKAEIRANPKVVTANAQPAKIYIAKEQYFSVVTGPLNYPYTRLEKVSAGIVLTIKPIISEKDEITVDIETEVSDAVGQGREGLPVIDSRKVTTKIRVKDQEYITIGGLTQLNVRKTQNKIPLLGSIPILGYFFSHTKYEKTKNDVVVLIKPHILSEGMK